MGKEPTTKCSEQKLVHSWTDTTPNIVYPTNPPQYPNKQEQCLNCGLVRTYHSRSENWFEYEIKELPQTYLQSVTISTDGNVTNGGGSINVTPC